MAEGSVVTIGKFDGVHLGHQEIIGTAVTTAKNLKLSSVALTFDRHPDALLNPEQCKLPLIGFEQKSSLISALGIDAMVTLEFDQALANMAPEEFVVNILVAKLKAKVVVVGVGFRFGSKGSGTVETLRDLGTNHGFEVIELESVSIDGEVVSTTRIRDLLDRGEVSLANRLLGRRHSSIGVIEHGLKIGRTIGFPTANMSRESNGYLPLDGVYAGWLKVNSKTYPTAISIGINETFGAVPRVLEAFVIDQADLDLYDKIVEVEYVEFIRPARKFDGVESLVAEIRLDIEKIRKILEIN